MSEKVDVLAVMKRTAADLAEHRQTHVVWRDWLQKDAANAAVNPHAGSAEFHAGVILDYDRHLANIEAARAAVAELIEAAREVERISSREHEAWIRLRAALAKVGAP